MALAAPLVVDSTAMAQETDSTNFLLFSPANPSIPMRIASGDSVPNNGYPGMEEAALRLPAAPEPAVSYTSSLEPVAAEMGGASVDPAAGIDHYDVTPSATWHQIPFSRIGIGADVSPLGIGIKSAIVLNHYFDGRLMGNFFSLDTGRFEIEGYNIDAKIHMLSGAGALDWYPFGSVFRLSPGVMFVNNNRVTVNAEMVPGTDITLGGHDYYSAKANTATGATPLTGVARLGLNTTKPALTATGGFGKFVPRSNRHWSFPSEFGVAFTGAPSIAVNVTGWACLDAKQTMCSNVGDPANPIAIEFNHDLQSRLTKLRTNLNKVQIYPILSYSVVYSFNIR